MNDMAENKSQSDLEANQIEHIRSTAPYVQNTQITKAAILGATD